MKRALLIAAATLVSASAFASVGVSVRSDYINTPKTKDNTGADIVGSSDFTPSYARINFGGKVGEADVKGSLNLLAATGAGAISALDFTDYLFIKKSLNEGWGMSAGKLINLTGGFEAEVIDAGNDYNASLANGGATVGGGFATQTSRLENASGFGIHFASGNHNVEIQVTDEADRTSTAPNNGHAYGLGYTGALSEGLWLKAHYFQAVEDAGATNDDHLYSGVGVKWASAPFELTFDYLMNSTKHITAETEDKTTSMVVVFKYTMESMTPFVKAEMSEVKADGADADKRTGLTAGLEMAQGTDFRYHLAYVQNTEDTAGDNVTDSKIIAGIKWDADLLK